MGTIAVRTGARPPCHLWIVGGLSALWSAGNCWQFALLSLRDTTTMTRFSPDVIDFIDAYPAWVMVAAAIEASFALLGALLLLGRSRVAPLAYAISLAGLAANQFYQLATGLPPRWNTWLYWVVNLAGWILAAGLLVYALRLLRRGVLT